MPIDFEYYRELKSYIEQITNTTEDELNDTTYNSLYLPELGLKITNSNVERTN